MKKGFFTTMSAQFFSSLADNALLVAAIELLKSTHAAPWQIPALTPMFARPAAWRVLDVGVAALMFGLAWGLLRPRSVDMDLIAAGACQTSAGARFGLKPQPAPKLAQCQQLVATRTAQSAP